MTIDSQSTALIENDEAADPPEWLGQVKKENKNLKHSKTTLASSPHLIYRERFLFLFFRERQRQRARERQKKQAPGTTGNNIKSKVMALDKSDVTGPRWCCWYQSEVK